MEHVEKFTQQFEQDEIVTIALENTTTIFKVSKAHLCAASKYFKKALEGEWKESTSGTLTVPGCEIDTFRLFLWWLAKHKQLPWYGLIDEDGEILYDDLNQEALVRLWAFADACLMPRLQNAAMETLCGLLQSQATGTEAVALAFERTAQDSPVRKVLLPSLVLEFRPDRVDEDKVATLSERFPEFVIAFTKQLVYCSCLGGATCKRTPECTLDSEAFMVDEN